MPIIVGSSLDADSKFWTLRFDVIANLVNLYFKLLFGSFKRIRKLARLATRIKLESFC